MLTLLAKLLSALNSEDNPAQISWAVALAFWFSILPLFSGLKWILLLVVLLFRVNLSTFLVMTGLFSVLAYTLDPLFNQFGLALLQSPSLGETIASLMALPVLDSLALNNTLALSSLLLGAVMFVPLFFASRWLVEKYREKFMESFEKLHLVKVIKSSHFFQIYQGLR